MVELPTMSDIEASIASNPLISVGIAGVTGAVAGAVGTVAVSSISRRKKSRRKKSGRSRDRRFKSKQKHEQRYKRKKKYKIYKQKGYSRDVNHRHRKGKVYYARKTGQPYIILPSGKAKFIKGKRRKR
jgi:hypothetical protein